MVTNERVVTVMLHFCDLTIKTSVKHRDAEHPHYVGCIRCLANGEYRYLIGVGECIDDAYNAVWRKYAAPYEQWDRYDEIEVRLAYLEDIGYHDADAWGEYRHCEDHAKESDNA